jgi:hypothetical protein
MSNKTYDFGFTFEDPTETVIHVQEPYSSQTIDTDDLKDEIMAKLYDIESRILTADQTTMISEHKRLVEMEVSEKLKQVEDLILPLLYNLMKNPEKDYIHWTGVVRTKTITEQIDKIVSITRYYEQS